MLALATERSTSLEFLHSFPTAFPGRGVRAERPRVSPARIAITAFYG
jgi:hypothetical protein